MFRPYYDNIIDVKYDEKQQIVVIANSYRACRYDMRSDKIIYQTPITNDYKMNCFDIIRDGIICGYDGGYIKVFDCRMNDFVNHRRIGIESIQQMRTDCRRIICSYGDRNLCSMYCDYYNQISNIRTNNKSLYSITSMELNEDELYYGDCYGNLYVTFY